MLGLEPVAAGYKEFRVRLVLDWGMTEAKGGKPPFGRAEVHWKTEGDLFSVRVRVPVGTTCRLILLNKAEETLVSGAHERKCALSDAKG